jgi:hypothetical protein
MGFYYDGFYDNKITDADFVKLIEFVSFENHEFCPALAEVEIYKDLTIYTELISNLVRNDYFCDHAKLFLCRGGHIPNTES